MSGTTETHVPESPSPSGIVSGSPAQGGPQRGRRRSLVITGVAAAAIGALFVLALVPVDQTQGVSFTQVAPNNATPSQNNVTFAHSGTFDFSWTTTGSNPLNFRVTDPSGTLDYYRYSLSNTGTIYVVQGIEYDFQLGQAGSLNETMTLTGTLHFTAPYL
jgi:hypothetical protein